MEVREFITQELEAFLEQHPQFKVQYKFDAMTNAHFVEVSPYEIYNDNDFLSWDLDFYDRFDDLFPYDNLCISSDEFSVIDTPELTLCGAEYVEQPRKTAKAASPKPKRTKKTKEVAV
jgi:hypothetical protein